MFRTSKKLIALFMLLWLPLSGGSALAASIAMQLQPGNCHAAAVMSKHGVDGHHHMAMQQDDRTGPADAVCATCAVCHLACSGFAIAPSRVSGLVEMSSQVVTFQPAIFISHVSVPLDPPPLARA